jgi:hypothetical protein
MYTATKTKKDFRGGIFQVTVDFVNGEETITEAFNISSEDDLNRKIENRLATLNELLALSTKLTLGVWEKPVKEVVVPPEPEPPTAEELKAQAISAKKQEVELAYFDFQKKLITEAEYDAKVAEYKSLVTEPIVKG